MLHFVHHLTHDGQAEPARAVLRHELLDVELRDGHGLERLAVVQNRDIEALTLGIEVHFDVVPGLAVVGMLDDVRGGLVDGEGDTLGLGLVETGGLREEPRELVHHVKVLGLAGKAKLHQGAFSTLVVLTRLTRLTRLVILTGLTGLARHCRRQPAAPAW